MHNKWRGDTLIEVLLAVTVFSLVAVGAIAILNNGLATAQRSLEITLARQQIDSQAEMLRFVHSMKMENQEPYVQLWSQITENKRYITDAPRSEISQSQCTLFTSSDKVFAFKPKTSGATGVSVALIDEYTNNVSVTPKVDIVGGRDVAQGISIQLTPVKGTGRAYDAYIQACWPSVGMEAPMTIGTIIRLYDNEVPGGSS